MPKTWHYSLISSKFFEHSCQQGSKVTKIKLFAWPRHGNSGACYFSRTLNRCFECPILHAASLLPNGKVLLAGGADGGTALSSSEVFDPVGPSFTASGNMNSARTGPELSVLPGGQALVVGGYNGAGGTSQTELYNYANGTFTTTGSLSDSRSGGRGVQLLFGHILLVGGQNSSNVYLLGIELY